MSQVVGGAEEEIARLEERLRLAMLTSNVAELDELLAPELVFTSHFGTRFGKVEDLSAHRTGFFQLSSLTASEQVIRLVYGVAVVSVRVQASGRFSGVPVTDDLRFTRVWAKSPAGAWQVVAGHSCSVRGE